MASIELGRPDGLAPGCAAQCPLNTAQLLGGIAALQTAPDVWMLSDSPKDTTFGIFSLNVVRTVVDYYEIEGGESNRGYGWSRTLHNPQFRRLGKMQEGVTDGANLTEKDIAELQLMVAVRNRRRDRFAALPPEAQQALFTDARPLLEDDFLVGMVGEFPFVKSDPRVAGLLDAREAVGPIDDSEWGRSGDFARQVYTLDQGPFMVARHALSHCSGPWRAWTQPWVGQPKPTQICPHGSPRDSVYEHAAAKVGTPPHPER